MRARRDPERRDERKDEGLDEARHAPMLPQTDYEGSSDAGPTFPL